jgi:hypothetical protein
MHTYIEAFDEDDVTAPETDDVRTFINAHHQDTMLTKLNLPRNSVECYFSTFQYDAYDRDANKLRSLEKERTSKFLNIISSNDNTTVYDQVRGIRLHDGVQLEGYECNMLNLRRLHEFSIVFYVTFDFALDDYTSFGKMFNLFEMYTTNVEGNIALGIHLRIWREDDNLFEEIIINFAGMRYTYPIDQFKKITNNINFFNGEEHMLTFIKYVENNKHYMKMTSDTEMILLDVTEINLDNIEYITNTRNRIVLSKEKFIVNKQVEGSHNNKIQYEPLKMYVNNIAIFNIGIHNTNTRSNVITTIYNLLTTQKHIELAKVYTELQEETTKTRETVATHRNNAQCRFNSNICDVCEHVDWTDFSTISTYSSCKNAIQDHCTQNTGNLQSEYEIKICDILLPPNSFHNASSSNTSNSEDADKCFAKYPDIKFQGLKTLTLDKVNRNTYNTTSNVYVPSAVESENIQSIPTSNLQSSIPNYDNLAYELLNRPIGNLSLDELVRLAVANKDNRYDVHASNTVTNTNTNTTTSNDAEKTTSNDAETSTSTSTTTTSVGTTSTRGDRAPVRGVGSSTVTTTNTTNTNNDNDNDSIPKQDTDALNEASKNIEKDTIEQHGKSTEVFNRIFKEYNEGEHNKGMNDPLREKDDKLKNDDGFFGFIKNIFTFS